MQKNIKECATMISDQPLLCSKEEMSKSLTFFQQFLATPPTDSSTIQTVLNQILSEQESFWKGIDEIITQMTTEIQENRQKREDLEAKQSALKAAQAFELETIHHKIDQLQKELHQKQERNQVWSWSLSWLNRSSSRSISATNSNNGLSNWKLSKSKRENWKMNSPLFNPWNFLKRLRSNWSRTLYKLLRNNYDAWIFNEMNIKWTMRFTFIFSITCWRRDSSPSKYMRSLFSW